MIQEARVLQTSRNAYTVANVIEMPTRDRRWALRMTVNDELNINKETIPQIL
jgi:hypothetical protein